VRLEGCPWSALGDPFVRAVQRAYAYELKGKNDPRYGEHQPHSLTLGVEIYRGAMNALRAYDAQKRDEQRELDRKQREAGGLDDAPRGMRGRRGPRRTR
jgi:hypothetical protein